LGLGNAANGILKLFPEMMIVVVKKLKQTIWCKSQYILFMLIQTTNKHWKKNKKQSQTLNTCRSIEIVPTEYHNKGAISSRIALFWNIKGLKWKFEIMTSPNVHLVIEWDKSW
jgi:hypothetical protein